MKVCIYSPSEKVWGGGQIYIDNLCRFLNERDVATVIATSEPESFSAPTLAMPSVSRKTRRIALSPALAKKLVQEGVQVVVLNDLSSLWLAPVFRIYGLKVVSLLHLYLQKKNKAGLGHGWLEFHLLRGASHFAHRVYSVNKDNQRSFRVPVEFVGNFISSWFFEMQSTDSKRYDLGLIARFSYEKNIPLFVRLVAKLNEISERPIRALMVGRGQEEDRIRGEIDRLNMSELITLQPWVERSELPGIFDQLRCFAITSFHEGFATTVLESHARGVPTITTRSAGFCREFVEGFGAVTGLAFDAEDLKSTDWLESILQLIDDSDAYAKACRTKAKRFTEEVVLSKLQSGIVSLIDDRDSRASQ